MSATWWRKVVPDTSPLRESQPYRLLWIGQLVSVSGSQLRHMVVAYHVYVLTKSSLMVGLVGAFQAVPLIAFSLWGGAIADAKDRRRLLLYTQIGLTLVMATLALTTQLGVVNVPIIYGLTALSASMFAIDAPARQSLIPTLVRREQIPAAMALNQVLFQTAISAGPILGGIVVGSFGIAFGYWIDAATFMAGWVAVFLMRTTGAGTASATATKAGWSSMVEGLRYLRSSQILMSMMGIDLIAMVFGWPKALFPYFAETVFKVGPRGLGLLFASPGIGALLGALTSGWASRIRRQGIAVIAAVGVWGAAVIAFGLLPSGFAIALLLMAVAGAADMYSAIFRGTIIQMTVRDELRGRITAVNLMVVISGPRLGEVESGVVARLFGPRVSVVSGGIACILGAALLAFTVPALARYRVPEEHEVIPAPDYA